MIAAAQRVLWDDVDSAWLTNAIDVPEHVERIGPAAAQLLADARLSEAIAAVLLLRTPAGLEQLGPTAKPIDVRSFSTAVERAADMAWTEGQTPTSASARWLVSRARDRYWAFADSQFRAFRGLLMRIGNYVNREDGEQEIRAALAKAARHYDPSRGPFRRYALLWVWTAFRLRNDMSPVSASTREAKRLWEARIEEGGPSEVQPVQVALWRHVRREGENFDDAVSDDHAGEDLAHRAADSAWRVREVERGLATLDSLERAVVELTFGCGTLGAKHGALPARKIAALLGYKSEDTVRAYKQRALAKLANVLREDIAD